MSAMLLPVLVIIANLAAVLAAPSSFTLVNNSGASTTQTVAVYTCQGLYNREPSTTAVYVLASSVDEFWLNATAPQHAGAPAVGFQPFINDCLATFTTYVRYNMTAQQKLLPSIVSIASDLFWGNRRSLGVTSIWGEDFNIGGTAQHTSHNKTLSPESPRGGGCCCLLFMAVRSWLSRSYRLSSRLEPT